MRRRRIGFTLVELLIVIFVIGMLASFMMLSIVSTSDSAKASIVVSNLRNVKAAGLLWFSSKTNSTDIEFISEWTTARMRVNLGNYVDTTKIAQYDFIYVPNVGYLIGEPKVPDMIINKVIKSAPGIELVDDKGNKFIYPVTEKIATVCVKIK